MSKINIDWNKVLTQAVATLVTLIVIGACVKVWNGYTSMDNKIADAIKQVADNQSKIITSMGVLGPEIDKLKEDYSKLTEVVNALRRGRKSTTELPKPSQSGSRPTREMVQQRWDNTRKR